MVELSLDNVSVIQFWGTDRLNSIQVWRRSLPPGTPNGILYGNAIGDHQKVEFHEWDNFRLVGMVGRADTYINRLSLIMFSKQHIYLKTIRRYILCYVDGTPPPCPQKPSKTTPHKLYIF